MLHDPNQLGDDKSVNRKEVIKGEFFENLYYLDWAATFGPIRPSPEPLS